jgi:hypothetical protein
MNRNFFSLSDVKFGGTTGRILLLCLASLCVYLLCGGFPPTNWRLLVQTLPTLHANLATYGNSFLVPFVILCVQALLLLLVWIWLIALIVRETFALLKGSSPGGQAPRPVSPVQSRPPVARSALPVVSTNDMRSAPSQMGTMTLGKTAFADNIRQRVPRPPGSAVPAAPPAPAPKLPAGPLYTPDNPFDVQPGVLDIFDEPGTVETSPFQPKAAGGSQSGVDQQSASPSPFVFGNPFEGPLPEVFEYDTDLKQSLAEFVQPPAIHEPPAAQQRKPRGR